MKSVWNSTPPADGEMLSPAPTGGSLKRIVISAVAVAPQKRSQNEILERPGSLSTPQTEVKQASDHSTDKRVQSRPSLDNDTLPCCKFSSPQAQISREASNRQEYRVGAVQRNGNAASSYETRQAGAHAYARKYSETKRY